jgi:hypothetical protein
MTEPHHKQPLCANSYTPTPWLMRILFTPISITQLFKTFPLLIWHVLWNLHSFKWKYEVRLLLTWLTQNLLNMIFSKNQKKGLPRSWCTINALWPSQRKNCKSRENARFGLHNVWLELKTSSYLLPHFCNFPPPFLLHGLVYVLSTCVPEVRAKSFECTIWQDFVPPVKYRGSPNSTVSTNTNSTSTNFCAIGIKFVLVEFVINKFVLVKVSLCTTQLVWISHSTIFPRSQKLY